MSILTLTLLFKGKALKSVALDEGTFTIGRDAGNDLQIDSLAVAPRHASIYIAGADMVVWQINPDFPITINGRQVSEHRLQPGDRIGVGKHQLYFSDRETTGEAEQAEDLEREERPESSLPIKPTLVGPEAHLQILKGKNIGVVIPLRKTTTRLGSEDSESAVITHGKDGYLLSPLTNDNHVSVNDADIRGESVRLSHGDILRVGGNVLQFFCQPENAESR